MSFRLTYSTMFDPPPELHEKFEAAVEKVRADLGRDHAHFIGGQDCSADALQDDVSPIDTDCLLGRKVFFRSSSSP